MKTNNELLNLCNNIKKLMADNNISDTKMMKIMHISLKTLKRIKNGEVPDKMTSLTLFYLHWYFNVNISSMFKEKYEIIEKE